MIVDARALGLVLARTRDAKLPNRPNLEVRGEAMWRRCVKLIQSVGTIDPVVVGSDDPAIIQGAKELGLKAYLFGGLSVFGTSEPGILAVDTLKQYEQEVGPLDPKTLVVIPEIGALCLTAGILAKAVNQAWVNPILQTVVSTTTALPLYLTNYRRGQRVLWHPSTTRLNRKGVCVDGALTVARLNFLYETGSILGHKSGIIPLPKQNSLVASDPLDLVAAKAYLEIL